MEIDGMEDIIAQLTGAEGGSYGIENSETAIAINNIMSDGVGGRRQNF